MSYLAGTVVRSTVVFTTSTGATAVDPASVSCVFEDPDGGTTSPTVVQTADPLSFYAEHQVPDTAGDGRWTVRWECSTPHIPAEATFDVAASRLASP